MRTRPRHQINLPVKCLTHVGKTQVKPGPRVPLLPRSQQPWREKPSTQVSWTAQDQKGLSYLMTRLDIVDKPAPNWAPSSRPLPGSRSPQNPTSPKVSQRWAVHTNSCMAASFKERPFLSHHVASTHCHGRGQVVHVQGPVVHHHLPDAGGNAVCDLNQADRGHDDSAPHAIKSVPMMGIEAGPSGF